MRSRLPKEVSWGWRKSAEKWWVEQRMNVANVPLQERRPGMERNLPRSQGLSYAPEEGKTREPGNKEWAWGAKGCTWHTFTFNYPSRHLEMRERRKRVSERKGLGQISRLKKKQKTSLISNVALVLCACSIHAPWFSSEPVIELLSLPRT